MGVGITTPLYVMKPFNLLYNPTKKIIVLLFLLTWVFSAYAQSDNKAKVIIDTNYLYTDTIKNKVYYGDYRSTGLLKTSDSCYIISTELRNYFPELTDTTYLRTDFKKYMEIQNLYSPHWHISSGSVFKLNRQGKKQWEFIFKEKRVKCIKKYDGVSFIAAGDRADLKKIWVARISSKDGKILWFKEFSAGYEPSLYGLSVAITSDSNIVILVQSRRIVPVALTKYYGKTRVTFFKKKDDFEQFLFLLNISGRGTLNWKKKIDFKKKYTFWGDNIAADNRIMIYSSYTGFDKAHGKYIKHEGEKVYQFDLKGHKLFEKKLEKTEGYQTYIDGWLFFGSNSDTIVIKKFDDRMNPILSKIIHIPPQYNRIQSVLKSGNSYYVYGPTNRKTGEFTISKLDTTFNFINSWIYKRDEWNDDILLIRPFDGDLMAVGNCYHRKDDGKLYQYVNLLEFKLR